jgi:cation diffusion facilitator family transporter
VRSPQSTIENGFEAGRRLAILSVAISAGLAVANVAVGLLSRSHAVTAAGLEFAGDVFASLIVFFGMWVASRPPDEDHPYGHGRFEILAGLLVGLLLILAGAGICFHSVQQLGMNRRIPLLAGVWAPLASMFVKGGLAVSKFRVGRRIGSAALIADAWNDSVDILSAAAALSALSLTLSDPSRFADADIYGGFIVGTLVILTGLRVVRDASLELTDTMPPPQVLDEIRRIANEVPRVEGIEKCFARKTGLQYHVDLHIEVDPSMTVAESHLIAHRVQEHVLRSVPYVAAVLVHVEPRPSGRIE